MRIAATWAARTGSARRPSQTHISQILHGKRAITTASGLRLSKALGLSERYWLNAQTRYDLEMEHDQHAAALDHVQVLVGAA